MHQESNRRNGSAADTVELFAGVQDIWAFVRRRKLWIASGLILGIAAAVGVHYILPSTTEVRAKMLVIRKDPNLPLEGAGGSLDFEGRVVEDILSTHMEIMQSPRIVGLALATAGLEALPSVLSELKEGETPVSYVRDNLTISRGGEGQAKAAHVLNVAFAHPVPQDGVLILEAVISSYRQFVDETFQNVGSEAVTLISRASDELDADLDVKQRALQQHRDQAPLLWNDSSTSNVHQARIGEYESELATLGVRKARLEARLYVIQQRLESPEADTLSDIGRLTLIAEEDMQRLSMVTDVERGSSLTEAFQATQPARSQIANVKYDRLLTLRMEARALEREFGPNHGPLRDKQREIAELEKLVETSEQQLDGGPERPEIESQELLSAYVSLLTQDLAEVENRESQLQELVGAEVTAAKEFVRYELQDQVLREEIAGSTELRNTVIDRLKEVNLVRDFGGFVTEVLAPVEPGLPEKISLPVLGVAGGIVGFLAGIAVAMLIDVTDKSFRGPQDVSDALGVPVLAHIPKVRLRSERASRRKSGGLRVAPAVWSALRPRSRDAEVFRALRSALCFGHDGGVPPRVIQITSPGPSDGKSVIAANLAVTLAQSCHNVLLVDCDLRSPSQHQLFQLPGDEGLSTLLEGETDFPDAVQSTAVEGLWAVPCGRRPSNPSELLTSQRFTQFLEMAREKYDFVLLDSAALLSVSDPASIAARADGVLLVLRLTKDARSVALDAEEKLDVVNARMAGVVVNCIDRGGLRFYGERGRDPVAFRRTRSWRHSDDFIDMEQPLVATQAAIASQPLNSPLPRSATRG